MIIIGCCQGKCSYEYEYYFCHSLSSENNAPFGNLNYGLYLFVCPLAWSVTVLALSSSFGLAFAFELRNLEKLRAFNFPLCIPFSIIL